AEEDQVAAALLGHEGADEAVAGGLGRGGERGQPGGFGGQGGRAAGGRYLRRGGGRVVPGFGVGRLARPAAGAGGEEQQGGRPGRGGGGAAHGGADRVLRPSAASPDGPTAVPGRRPARFAA